MSLRSEMKKCVFILPYFGKFNNYFPFFLKSFSKNTDYDILIITDNTEKYHYPQNVKILPYTLDDFRRNAESKLGFAPCIPKPYKLCDYKPAYGFLFEEYIKDYQYWGHCDCDLIFGDLNRLLTPILQKDYDKIFAAGHLTIYRNNYDNNRLFLSQFRGRYLYREAFLTDKIYAFDEDYRGKKYPDSLNIHSIFLDQGKKIYSTDMAFSAAPGKAKLTRAAYQPSLRAFKREETRKSRFYWDDGRIIELSLSKNSDALQRREYIYIHLQSRSMKPLKNIDSEPIEIRATSFRPVTKLPSNAKEMHVAEMMLPNTYWLRFYGTKILRKLKRTLKSLN